MGLEEVTVDVTKGPAGRIRRALLYRQHRRQGSAGAWERRRGVAPLACRWPCNCRAVPNWSFLRIVLDGRGPRNRLTQPLCIFAFFRRSAPGVPEADRSLG